MRSLQEAGVPVGVMNRVNDLRTDPQVVARTVFRSMHQPQIGNLFTGGAPARFSSINEPDLAPAPMYGEHTRAIAREHLGLSPQEIDALVADGVLDDGDLQSNEHDKR
jgi:crotonobetainyl-CoA:carnitine CoA-transferase CaiB-like acyl-CoA transferase